MSILTMHHGLMAGIKQGDPPGYVTIGQHLYPYVQIGNKLWTARNLYEPIGTEGVGKNGNYVDGHEWNPPIRDVYTFYYSTRIVLNDDGSVKSDFTTLLPEGWRLPTEDDILDLASRFIIGTYEATDSGWSPATNTTGLSLYRNGYVSYSSINGKDSQMVLMVQSGLTSGKRKVAVMNSSSSRSITISNYSDSGGSSSDYLFLPIRLVKDT